MMTILFFVISGILGISILLFRNKPATRLLTLSYALLHIGFTIYAWLHLNETEAQFFSFNSIGVLLLTAMSLLVIPTIYHGFIYTKNDSSRRYRIYHAALIALMTFMSGAYLANGMTVLWIFVEATTLAVAALIYHDRTEVSLEATWKYVFVCSIGISMAYIGILFLGFIFGRSDAASLSFDEFSAIISQSNPLYLKVAFVFVLVGFSTKMGLFPMHTVTIDAHSVAPPPISALISTTLMNVGFLAIFRVYTLFADSTILSFMNNALITSGLLSILIAAGYMLKAKHLKRMLAYSSLENMGLVAISIGIGGSGYYAAILIILLHTLSKSSLFYQMGQISRVLHTFKLDESGNYMKLYPAGGLVLLAGTLTILAIPPSGLFVSELLMAKSFIANEQWIVFSITLVLLTCVLYAMSTRVMHILFSGPRTTPESSPGKVNSVESVTQFIFLGIVVMFCFYQPPFIVELINQSIAALMK